MQILFHESDIEFFSRTAPSTPVYRFLGRDGNPERLLETHTLEDAYWRVKDEHRALADWISETIGPASTGDDWRYVSTSKRLKLARKWLRRLMIEEFGEESVWERDE